MQDGSPHRDALRLRRVVLRSADDARPDPLLARQRLERTLATTDWRAPGLPPGALLFVRHLRVRGPAFAATGPRRDTGADDRDFALHIAQSLREQGRAARRPWRDPADAVADAVWFEDEHELAACLVRDWLRGLAAQRWWWRAALADAGIDAWLRAELLRRGERLAPTLQRLASVSLATAWLARMDDADAETGFDALVRAYALPHVVDARAETTDAGRDRPGLSQDRTATSMRTAAPRASTASRRRLLRIVPELEAAHWRPPQVRLLAYALALLRAPSDVRSPTFAADVAAWRPAPHRARADRTRPGLPADAAIGIDARRAEAAPALPRSDSVGGDRPQAAALPAGVAASTAASGDVSARPSPASTPRDAPFAVVDDAARQADAGARDAHERITTAHARSPMVEMRASDLPVPAQASPAHDAIEDARVAVETIPVEATTEVAHAIATDYGGLFYVFNAALALGLYGDFSAPRLRGIALSPWDLLAWLGRHWFGRAFRRDPLWGVLASLAGRSSRRAPAWRGDAPARWAPDDDWLRAWAPITRLDHCVDRRAGRLHVLHPAGFALFDVPRDTRLRPSAQARALCLTRAGAARAGLRSATTTSPAVPADPGQRWLHRIDDYLAARFARAFGIASARDAVVLLCRHHAGVRCDASRIDVSLSLSTLPLPVRIAGLDRDPGWIPAAGRDVRFHFS